jgi:hypothetical protein
LVQITCVKASQGFDWNQGMCFHFPSTPIPVTTAKSIWDLIADTFSQRYSSPPT